jgi:UDP-N-acetylmuramate: L-alanyl-gamma-D-glutamyl-meso-diaminopimelate ligase
MAVIAAAHDRGLIAREIAAGLATFEGVRRRMETRGEKAGVKVLDDFAHHPTAIAETLQAVRRRYPGSRVRAIVEPRSWSMRRNVFQQRLADALTDADEVVIAAVYGADAVPVGERLDPGKLVEDLAAHGCSAVHIPDVESIVRRVARDAKRGDVVVVMSNGGFEQIHERLLAALAGRSLPAGSTLDSGK